MAPYRLFVKEKLGVLLKHLPEEQKGMAKLILAEAIKLSRQQMNVSKHSTDASIRMHSLSIYSIGRVRTRRYLLNRV